jgi:GMP synthase-like glutamine amidotransferase
LPVNAKTFTRVGFTFGLPRASTGRENRKDLTLRILALQHVVFEEAGAINAWVVRNGHTLDILLVETIKQWPEPVEFDMLIILGGPMSVHDEAFHPWLKVEKRWLNQFIELKRPVLGICLGAQLLAETLGGSVYKATEKEIGWFPVQPVLTGRPTGFHFSNKLTPLHWHGETFDLPKNAIRLAETATCLNQAFIFEDRVIGLQFHLEATSETVEKLLDAASHEIGIGVYQQTPEIIRGLNHLASNANRELFILLDYLGQYACLS